MKDERLKCHMVEWISQPASPNNFPLFLAAVKDPRNELNIYGVIGLRKLVFADRLLYSPKLLEEPVFEILRQFMLNNKYSYLSYETTVLFAAITRGASNQQKYSLIKKGMLKDLQQMFNSKYTLTLDAILSCMGHLVTADQESPVSKFYYSLIQDLEALFIKTDDVKLKRRICKVFANIASVWPDDQKENQLLHRVAKHMIETIDQSDIKDINELQDCFRGVQFCLKIVSDMLLTNQIFLERLVKFYNELITNLDANVSKLTIPNSILSEVTSHSSDLAKKLIELKITVDLIAVLKANVSTDVKREVFLVLRNMVHEDHSVMQLLGKDAELIQTIMALTKNENFLLKLDAYSMITSFCSLKDSQLVTDLIKVGLLDTLAFGMNAKHFKFEALIMPAILNLLKNQKNSKDFDSIVQTLDEKGVFKLLEAMCQSNNQAKAECAKEILAAKSC